MAVRLLIPAYAWSLMTLWGEEIKDVMRGERKSEQEPEEEGQSSGEERGMRRELALGARWTLAAAARRIDAGA